MQMPSMLEGESLKRCRVLINTVLTGVTQWE
jgi:hypothetical protein